MQWVPLHKDKQLCIEPMHNYILHSLVEGGTGDSLDLGHIHIHTLIQRKMCRFENYPPVRTSQDV